MSREFPHARDGEEQGHEPENSRPSGSGIPVVRHAAVAETDEGDIKAVGARERSSTNSSFALIAAVRCACSGVKDRLINYGARSSPGSEKGWRRRVFEPERSMAANPHCPYRRNVAEANVGRFLAMLLEISVHAHVHS